MKQELQELISLTELFIYENYSFPKPKSQPVIPALEAAKPAAQPFKGNDAPARSAPPQEIASQSPIKAAATSESTASVEKDFSDLERIFMKDLPHIPLHKQLPDDTVAKQKSDEWKHSHPIAYILTAHETKQELNFLQNIANSITVCFGTARLVPIQELKESHFHADLKLCIAQHSITHPLIQNKLLPIDTIANYFANPSAKAILWKAISDKFSCR